MSDVVLTVLPSVALLATWLGLLLVLGFWVWMLAHAYTKGSLVWMVIVFLVPVVSAIYYLDARPMLSKPHNSVLRKILLVEAVLLSIVLLALVSPSL